jgi:putative oxidoreductase
MATQKVSVVSQPVGFSAYNAAPSAASGVVVLAGRLLFSFIFLLAGPFHFSQADIGMAAAHGVPLPNLVVPATGILAFVAALSVLLGFRARLGAWLLVIFLVPVTVTMHNFWAVTDPTMQMIQMAMFMKNLSMIGGALLISQFGAGPWSLDAKRARS